MTENERLHPSAPEALPKAEHEKAVELAKQQHAKPQETDEKAREELPQVHSGDI